MSSLVIFFSSLHFNLTKSILFLNEAGAVGRLWWKGCVRLTQPYFTAGFASEWDVKRTRYSLGFWALNAKHVDYHLLELYVVIMGYKFHSKSSCLFFWSSSSLVTFKKRETNPKHLKRCRFSEYINPRGRVIPFALMQKLFWKAIWKRLTANVSRTRGKGSETCCWNLELATESSILIY